MELHVRKTLQLASRVYCRLFVRILPLSRAIDADRENYFYLLIVRVYFFLFPPPLSPFVSKFTKPMVFFFNFE